MAEEEEESCEFCGSTENVMYGRDPYGSELYDDENEYWICETCFQERLADI